MQHHSSASRRASQSFLPDDPVRILRFYPWRVPRITILARGPLGPTATAGKVLRSISDSRLCGHE